LSCAKEGQSKKKKSWRGEGLLNERAQGGKKEESRGKQKKKGESPEGGKVSCIEGLPNKRTIKKKSRKEIKRAAYKKN